MGGARAGLADFTGNDPTALPASPQYRPEAGELGGSLTLKDCEHCGREFSRPKGTGLKLFARRRYCSRTCFSAAKSEIPRRHCEYCGTELKRKIRPNGELEPRFPHFVSRKFCDQGCMAAAFDARPVKSYPSWSTAHHHARKACPPGPCARCGTPCRTDVHHRDDDWRNNAPANLERLCRSCHIKEHRDRTPARRMGRSLNQQ